MLEIVIPKPEYSQYPQSLRRYSADRPGDLWHKTYFLRRHKVTPQTHPLAADLFAGDGSMAWHLCNLGWRRENITCFDKVVTPTPFSGGCELEILGFRTFD